MRRLLILVGILVGSLVVVNARMEATRTCACNEGCWCKRPVLRHFRWVAPFSHDIPEPTSV
jgi:hypothetical protein